MINITPHDYYHPSLQYHIFHESNRSFDSRQFGTRYLHMRSLLFMLATVNIELLDVNNGRNANLTLNMQSLGKSYGNVDLHIFAENSIQYVNKVRNMNKSTSDRNSTNSWSFATNGLLVNCCLGRVSDVGINAVSITRFI